METLSKDTIFELLLHLPLAELSKICTQSSELHNICNSNHFWLERIKIDFPDRAIDPNNHRLGYIYAYQDAKIKAQKRKRREEELLMRNLLFMLSHDSEDVVRIRLSELSLEDLKSFANIIGDHHSEMDKRSLIDYIMSFSP